MRLVVDTIFALLVFFAALSFLAAFYPEGWRGFLRDL